MTGAPKPSRFDLVRRPGNMAFQVHEFDLTVVFLNPGNQAKEKIK